MVAMGDVLISEPVGPPLNRSIWSKISRNNRMGQGLMPNRDISGRGLWSMFSTTQGDEMSGKAEPTALITGGTRGIGLSTARALAARGYRLVLNGRYQDTESRDAVCALAETVKTDFVEGDVADPKTCRALVDRAVHLTGRLDVLVHAAGGAVPGTVTQLSEEAWMDAFQIHVHAAFHLFRASHPWLAKRGGSVLLISSAAGLRGCPGTIAYQTVKGALPQMARALARDHGGQNIRVNVIAPGIIETRFHDNMPGAARENSLQNRIPLNRFGAPEDVASAAVELLINPFITGETLVIDGGMSMRMV